MDKTARFLGPWSTRPPVLEARGRGSKQKKKKTTRAALSLDKLRHSRMLVADSSFFSLEGCWLLDRIWKRGLSSDQYRTQRFGSVRVALRIIRISEATRDRVTTGEQDKSVVPCWLSTILARW